MKNKRPIFIVGFQYGGTNLVQNLLLSHPELCCTRGEAQELFRGRKEEPLNTKIAKRARFLPILLKEDAKLFKSSKWQKTTSLKPVSQKRIDSIFFNEKLRAQAATQNRFKAPETRYSREEIKKSRLVVKMLNGLMLLDDTLLEMYPTATFIAVIRNGLDICDEAQKRGYSIDTMSEDYQRGCQHIITQSKKYPNYHVFRYEDLIEKPLNVLDEIFKAASLDFEDVSQIRLEHSDQAKKRAALSWCSPEELDEQLRVNLGQRERALKGRDKRRVLQACLTSLRHFSYV